MVGSIKQIYDIAIVGGGPAGSAAAIRLANAGLSVLLCEQKSFPREKLCGEFISPECLADFAELGVMPKITAAMGSEVAETVFFSRSGKGVTIPSTWFGNAAFPALGLSRSHMDALLIERASDSGVEVHQETAGVGLLFNEKRVIGLTLRTGDGEKKDVNAKLTIDATGRNRSLARLPETKNVQKKPASQVAFKTHLSGVGSGLPHVRFTHTATVTAAVTKSKTAFTIYALLSRQRTRSSSAAILSDYFVRLCFRTYELARHWPMQKSPRRGSPSQSSVMVAASLFQPSDCSRSATRRHLSIRSPEAGFYLPSKALRIVSDAIAQGLTAGHDFDRLANEYARRYGSSFNARLRVCSILRYATSAPILAEAAISLLGFSGSLRRRIAAATRFSAAPDA